MLPEIFTIGSLSIKSYGLLLAIGFLVGLNYARKQAERINISPSHIQNLSIYILLGAILGARIHYVIFHWNEFSGDLLELFKLWHGGLDLYGGIIFSVIVVLLYAHVNKINLWRLGDILVAGFFLGKVFARIGCFLAGCCYGKPTNLPWGVIFTDIRSLAPRGIRIHPTQLYESLFALMCFLTLKKISIIKKFHGKLFFIGLLLYSLFRFFNEFLRGDHVTHNFLNTYQVISVVIFIICSIIILFFKLDS